MTPDTIIVLAIQFLTLIGYFFTAKYQNKRIENMEQSMNGQRDLLKSQADTIKTFEEYKKLINLSDVEKNIALKIDNLHLEYKRTMGNRESEIADIATRSAAKTFITENKKMLRAWSELVNINAQFIMNQFPEKSQNQEREDFINKILPFNAEYLVPMIEAWMSGEIEKFKRDNLVDELFSDDSIPQEK